MFFSNPKSDCKIWIDSVLENINTKGIKSYNFNLYEGGNNDFHLQLSGSNKLPSDTEDWACSEVFSTGENIFIIKRRKAGNTWENGLEYFKSIISDYLSTGKYKDILNKSSAVGIGFVDGDIDILVEK